MTSARGRNEASVERSEVARSLNLSVIRYSRVWEDHRVLSKALQIKPDDDILSITRCGSTVIGVLYTVYMLTIAALETTSCACC